MYVHKMFVESNAGPYRCAKRASGRAGAKLIHAIIEKHHAAWLVDHEKTQAGATVSAEATAASNLSCASKKKRALDKARATGRIALAAKRAKRVAENP